MIYGVKVIHTYSIGEDKRRFYEELILRVTAESYDKAYKKAERYMRDQVCQYTNPDDKLVKTVAVVAVDCFLACDSKDDVQEVYSSFTANGSSLPEDEYYRIITLTCSEEELRPLRNKEYN